jgi:type VI secretion system protein VasI
MLIFSPGTVLCQDEELKKAIAQCAAIDDINDRLGCFDSLAKAVAKLAAPGLAVSDAVPSDQPTPGQWQVLVDKDPLDDSTSVALGLLGNELKAQLVVRCRQKKLDVLLSWRGRFMGATAPVVWTRLGAAKAEKKRWSLSSDHKAALLAKDVTPFVKQLLSVDRLVVQTDHFAQGRITEVFDVHGLEDAIGPVKEQCTIE